LHPEHPAYGVPRRGWRDRQVEILNPKTGGVAWLCPEVSELALSEYIAAQLNGPI